MSNKLAINQAIKMRNGFARVGILLLLLTVAALVTSVYVAKNGTQYLNMASEGQRSWTGEVGQVSPCVNGNLCYELTGSNSESHYLLGVGLVNLRRYVDQQVKVSGTLMKNVNPNYIYVVSVALVPTPNPGWGGNSCKSDADCVSGCRPPLRCAQRAAEQRCVNGRCVGANNNNF